MPAAEHKAESGGKPLAGVGHNAKKTAALTESSLKRLERLDADKADFDEQWRSDLGELVKEVAEEFGCSEKVVKTLFSEHRHFRKLKKKIEGMDQVERNQSETLLDVHADLVERLGDFGNTGLGTAAIAAVRKSAEITAPGTRVAAPGTRVMNPNVESLDDAREGSGAGSTG